MSARSVKTFAVYKHKLTGVYGLTSFWPSDPMKMREVFRDLNCPHGYCLEVCSWFHIALADLATDWELMKEIPR